MLGGPIGAGIALRGIRVISEQKYFGTRLISFVILGTDSRSRYFVRSVAVEVLPTSTFLEYRLVILYSNYSSYLR